ncbi:MAG: pyruvate ferredoxin oxidoreductase [Thermoprotei archaeon]|nr:MAG: pyruvate ferredoxin oxidoreductase [Thermoprotei archaeon]
MRLVLTGNYAAAYAAKAAKVEVVSAYPITPQTQVVEKLSEFIERGEMNARYIRVESEHSAMAACIGAAMAGARVFTATSAHGLIYMSEMLWWAAGARLPIVMGVITRAMAPPWSIWSDHCDLLSLRDIGWIIYFCENAQEVFDTIIQAYKVAENEEVLLPVMVGWDAFQTSHTAEPVDVLSPDEVSKYLPPRRPLPYVIDFERPFTHGSLCYPDRYMEFRYLMDLSMSKAKKAIVEADEEYGDLFGRKYGGVLEKYLCEDAEIAVVTMGVLSGDARYAVDILRKEGYKVGLVRLRVVRPFPSSELKKELKSKKLVCVIDRNISIGRGGILGTEIKALLKNSSANVVNVVAGIGGRDVSYEDIVNIVKRSLDLVEKGEVPEYMWYGIDKEYVVKAVGEYYEPPAL